MGLPMSPRYEMDKKQHKTDLRLKSGRDKYAILRQNDNLNWL